MSTTAASGLLAIVVCALVQGNPLQMQLRIEGGQACLLRAGSAVSCATWPTSPAWLDTQRGRR